MLQCRRTNMITEASRYVSDCIYDGLDIFSQDAHRGMTDKALAKEMGLVQSLRCAGVMTTGDFFAPETMVEQRTTSGRGRGSRVVPAGSYRIRSDVRIFF